MISDRLAATLERAEAALADHDLQRASIELSSACALCSEAHTAGVQFEAEALRALRALQARGAAAAEAARTELGRELGSAGTARRAGAAYRR